VVVDEQLDCVIKALNWVSQSLIHQDFEIYQFVPPINFKDWLESLEELFHFGECARENRLDHLFLVHMEWVVLDPSSWFQLE